MSNEEGLIGTYITRIIETELDCQGCYKTHIIKRAVQMDEKITCPHCNTTYNVDDIAGSRVVES